MTVHYLGIEEEDINTAASPYYQRITTSGRYRSAYGVRYAISIATGLSVFRTIYTHQIFSCTSLYLRSIIYYYQSQTRTNARFFGIVDAGTNKGIWIGTGETNRQLRLFLYDGSTQTTLETEAGESLILASCSEIIVHIDRYGEEDAIVEVYINKEKILTYQGDISISGVTELSGVATRSNGYNLWEISELYVSDTFPALLLAVAKQTPSGSGDSSDMVGTYADINTYSNNMMTTVSSNTNDHDAHYALSALPDEEFNISAVSTNAYIIRTADATPTGVQMGHKIPSGAAAYGSTVPVSVGEGVYRSIIESPLSEEDAADLQLSLKVVG